MTIDLAADLPTWDMTTIYPGIDSPEYRDSVGTLTHLIADLESLLGSAELAGDLSGADLIVQFEEIVAALNVAINLSRINNNFLEGYTSVNSRDIDAQARNSELQLILVRLAKADSRFNAWIGKIDIEFLIAQSDVAKSHAYVLGNAVIEAQHQMDQPLENLAIELGLTGGAAWSRLHDDLTSQIMVQVRNEHGEIEVIPMSEAQNLASDPDRNVRRRAHEARLDAWKQWQTPIAAALNSVKGEHTALSRQRGWDSILDQALFQNHIDRQALDVMLQAARAAFPDFHRYLAAKAKALGLDRLSAYDLYAPLPGDSRTWPWEEGFAFVVEQFGTFSPRLRGLAERALAERWIDVGPREGKLSGAFCMRIRADESRILLNYTQSSEGITALAHELGHAYHNLCQAGVPALRRRSTPMALAETASTFCELILTKAAIAQGTEDDALAILEASLQELTLCVVGISGAFQFEQAVCEKRIERELSADEFSRLILESIRDTYGDSLVEDTWNPYMWAAVPHFYSPSKPFYNYPYIFGLLFGLGLYARYQEDPDTFRDHYDDLLAATGDADAATLARQFGFDLHSPAFWEGSLGVIRTDIDTFVGLVDRRFPQAT